ncbi:hypothetical protein [Mycolicibacterium iranicum]|uniref:hypothetical protein n=1 Tax=Mycolicibacterium iranicum TaxID=912594 RepID=UPI000465C349|nr:hypothetical protein [Mycolicibacterium iranicum]
MPNRTRKPRNTTAVGLGWNHQQARDRMLRRHINGNPCWWCGKPMYREAPRNHDGRPLHADHTRPRSRGGLTADRLLHGSCNEARGDGSRDHERPAAVTTTAHAPTDGPSTDLGPLAMPWPDSFR